MTEEKSAWLVGICDSDGNRIFLSSVRGTKDEVKKYLLRLAQEQARIEYIEGSGVVNDVPESENDVQEITYDDGTTILSTGCEYGDHHCIITAEPEKQPLDLTDIPEQTGAADDPGKTKPIPNGTRI